MLLTFAAAPFARAQNLCTPCHHEISPKQTYVHVACKTGYLNCDPSTQDAAIFVIITYRRVTCEGDDVQIVIDGAVVVDDRKRVVDEACPGETTALECFSTPDPLPAAYIKQYLNDGIAAAINALGASMQVKMLYPGSCISWVTYQFPEKVFSLVSRGDATGSDTVWTSPQTVYYQPMPCGNACCKIIYKHVIKTLESGETTMTWEPSSWEGDNDKCESYPLPDYNKSLYSNSGTSAIPPYQKVYPVVLSKSDCEVFCKEVQMPPPHGDKVAPRFSTDVTGVKDELRMELEAHPTLFSQYIRFTTNHAISQVVVYDMSGRRVMQQASPAGNELNTAALKNGMYYVQVYLPGNVVKTIKVMKQ